MRLASKLSSILKRGVMVLPLLAGLAIGLGVGLGQEASVEDPDKVPPNPEAGLSDQQRQQLIDELIEKSSDWVKDFVERGRDPRSLPLDKMEVWSLPLNSPKDALSSSNWMIQGEVVSTTYFTDWSGETRSVATVKVLESLNGSLNAKSIDVFQIGGPTWTSDGGVLQQLEGDPLLLPGDEVILLLVPARSEAQRALGRYQTVYGAGVFLVTPSGVRAPETNAFQDQVNGRTVDELLALFK